MRVGRRMKTRLGSGIVATVAVIAVALQAAEAAVIVTGLTFSVATDNQGGTVGDHFHSKSAVVFGNPVNKAEVGGFPDEEVRGMSEFNLAGQIAGTAFLTFDVFKKGGLFLATNDTPFTGTIALEAYAGNGSEDVGDFEAASTGSIGSFAVSPAGLNVGDTLSFDVTSIFSGAVGTNLGIRLRATSGLDPEKAWTFDNFRLTTDNQCSVGAICINGTVPEPTTLALFGLGLAGLAAFRRLKR